MRVQNGQSEEEAAEENRQAQAEEAAEAPAAQEEVSRRDFRTGAARFPFPEGGRACFFEERFETIDGHRSFFRSSRLKESISCDMIWRGVFISTRFTPGGLRR